MKDEVYKVAFRYQLPVVVVSNSWIRTPTLKLITQIVVDQGPDVAGRVDRLAPGVQHPLGERDVGGNDDGVAVRPLGDPVVGRVFTADNIGAAVASRGVGEHLRSMGEITGGPNPFTAADRSKFLQALDAAVVRAKRR